LARQSIQHHGGSPASGDARSATRLPALGELHCDGARRLSFWLAC
jgi:hypothetical protein